MISRKEWLSQNVFGPKCDRSQSEMHCACCFVPVLVCVYVKVRVHIGSEHVEMLKGPNASATLTDARSRARAKEEMSKRGKGKGKGGVEEVHVKSLAEIKAEKEQRAKEDLSDKSAHTPTEQQRQDDEQHQEGHNTSKSNAASNKNAQQQSQASDNPHARGKKRKTTAAPEVKSLEQIRAEKEAKRQRGESTEADDTPDDDPKLQHKTATVSAGNDAINVSMSVHIPEHKRRELEEKRKKLQEQYKHQYELGIDAAQPAASQHQLEEAQQAQHDQ